MTWLLIDANNWFAQCDYANPEAGAANFQRRLDTLLGQVKHARAVLCWDGGKSWRCELSDSYKAHRAAKPDGFGLRLQELQEQIGKQHESLQVARFEADDLIATLVTDAHHEGEQAIVFSADADLHQLLRADWVTQVTKVSRQSHDRHAFVVVTAARLIDKYGVKAEQWVDYRAIVGDASDGIKGCPGLGPEAARKLLQWKPTLDDALDVRNRWSVPISDRQMRSLIAYQPQLATKRKMLRLVNNVPLPSTSGSGAAS